MSLMADIPLVKKKNIYIYIFALLLRNKQTSFNQPGPNSFLWKIFLCIPLSSGIRRLETS